jgi:hypothetical protein
LLQVVSRAYSRNGKRGYNDVKEKAIGEKGE